MTPWEGSIGLDYALWRYGADRKRTESLGIEVFAHGTYPSFQCLTF